jgi:predicted nucleic acid-binding protein
MCGVICLLRIVSSALNANCNILASEDMQDGLKINNMIINNIFNKNIITPNFA